MGAASTAMPPRLSVLGGRGAGESNSPGTLQREDSSISFYSADSKFTAVSRVSQAELDAAVEATRLLVVGLEARVLAGGAPQDLVAAEGLARAVAAPATASGAVLEATPLQCSWRQALEEALADERLALVAATALGSTGGATALGTGGAVVGLTAGSIVGAVCGLAPAFLTVGLSIPMGAALGGAGGLCLGAATGGAAGFVGGGYAGYYCYNCRRARQLDAAAAAAKDEDSSPRLFPGSSCIHCSVSALRAAAG